jgi:hypothetical protein
LLCREHLSWVALDRFERQGTFAGALLNCQGLSSTTQRQTGKSQFTDGVPVSFPKVEAAKWISVQITLHSVPASRPHTPPPPRRLQPEPKHRHAQHTLSTAPFPALRKATLSQMLVLLVLGIYPAVVHRTAVAHGTRTAVW